MAEIYELGSQLREFLHGLLDAKNPEQWGPRIDIAGLRDNFAPQKVEPYTATPGGIDNLALHSTDTFVIPGRGEFIIDFKGFFRVARSNPTTSDWNTSEVFVNIVDLKLHGSHEATGPISVSLNPDIVSTGQIFPTTVPGGPKACRIATGAVFDIPKLGMTVFNKEPILLMNENIKSIPPVDDPSGHALLFRVPLFDRKNASGRAVAYLTSLRYGADNYLSEAEVMSIRTSSAGTR
jgi:hypothetical protein